MTEPRSDEAVHQAFFGWSLSHQKLDLISCSFHNQPEARSWRAKLEEHARLQPSNTEKPVSSLSYIDLEDGYVAVLRRVAQGHTAGRNNSHALIGPAATIDVRVALGLGVWDGWLESAPEGQYLPKYQVGQIAGVAGRAERLGSHIEQVERGLGMVLAQLLDNPTLPLSVIGCRNQLRLPMVWGLYAAAAGWLQGFGRRWTFSTYEVLHDDSIRCLPEIVFLPARPLGAGNVTRTIVDLDTETQASPDSSHLAGQLLATALHGTPSPVPQPVRDTVPANAGTVVHGAAISVHPTRVEQRAAGHGLPRRQQAQPRKVDALLHAKSVTEFEAALKVLETHTRWPPQRQELRTELDLGTMNMLAHFIESTANRELFKRLLKITYGPSFEDLNDVTAHQHADRLVKDGDSDRLAMILGRAADHEAPQVRDNALYRVPRPTRTDRATRQSSDLKNRWLSYGAAAIGLLALAFMLGILVGRPDSAQTATVPQTGGRPGTQTPPESTPAPVPASGFKVRATPNSNQVVFGFAVQGLNFIPQAPCAPLDNVNWTCPYAGQSDQTDSNAPQPKYVAFMVPQAESDDLDKERNPVPKGEQWYGPLPAF
jgi:hypothetical protein